MGIAACPSVCSSHADIDSKLTTVGHAVFAVGLSRDSSYLLLTFISFRSQGKLQTRLGWVKTAKNARKRSQEIAYRLSIGTIIMLQPVGN